MNSQKVQDRERIMSKEALRVRCIALMNKEAQLHLLDFLPLQELCGHVHSA